MVPNIHNNMLDLVIEVIIQVEVGLAMVLVVMAINIMVVNIMVATGMAIMAVKMEVVIKFIMVIMVNY